MIFRFDINSKAKDVDKDISLKLYNFKAKNITAAPVPNADTIKFDDIIIEGKVEKAFNDDRTTMEGDIVHIWANKLNGKKEYLGNTKVNSTNEWKYEVNINKSEILNYTVQVEHPRSGNKSKEHQFQILKKPVLEVLQSGDKEISGHGKPGNTIVIEDKEGNVLGEVEVDKDGDFKIDLDDPLEEGDKIVAYPKGGEEDDNLKEEVVVKENLEDPEEPDKEKLEKPVLEVPEFGDKEIKGKGKPGNTIVIEDKEGNVLGEVEVDKDGDFKIDLDNPLEEGDKIVAYPKGGEEDDNLKEEVVVKENLENPEEPGDIDGVITINKPLIGDQEVRGTYLPNKKVVIKDADNNVLGEGFTNENGDYNVSISRALMAGELIYAYPMINDKLGKPAQGKVNDTDNPKGDSEENNSSNGSSSGSSSSSRRKKRDKNNDTKDEEKEAVGDIFYKTENNSISDSMNYLKDHKLNTNDHFSYIKGYTDKTVRPESYITREEVAAVFYRLLDETYRKSIEIKSHNFKDLDNNRWSTIHIATLANGNILKGYQDGTFRPKDNITRAELTSIISGLSELKLENINRDKAETFIDISGHWVEDYIKSGRRLY